MMTRCILAWGAALAGALSIAPPATCQSTTLATESEVGVFTFQLGGSNSHQSIPASTTLTSSRSIRAGSGANVASMDVQPSALGFRLLESAAARCVQAGGPQYAGTATSAASTAPHSFLWTLRNRGVGRIIVDLTGRASSVYNNHAHVDIDVGADGSVEVSRDILPPWTPFRTELPVSFRSDLRVRVTVDGRATTTNAAEYPFYSMDLSLQYVPRVPPARITPYGPSCGPVLLGADNPTGFVHHLEFTMLRGLPGAYSAFVFGVRKISSPLLGTSCLLLTDPVAHVFGTTLASGLARYAIDLPGPIPTADLQVQAIAFDFTPRVLSTNGVDVAIRD